MIGRAITFILVVLFFITPTSILFAFPTKEKFEILFSPGQPFMRGEGCLVIYKVTLASVGQRGNQLPGKVLSLSNFYTKEYLKCSKTGKKDFNNTPILDSQLIYSANISKAPRHAPKAIPKWQLDIDSIREYRKP